MNLCTYFSDLRELGSLSMFLRLLLSALCGGLIGMSRGRRQHAAGLRTHLLVCIGSACVMVTSQFISQELGASDDMLRMPAQVVSGIGFLGAGSIIVTGKRHISGLTTAAGLWSSACMGLAAGAGYYECALLMCLFIYVVLVTLNRLDNRHIKTSRLMAMYLELDSQTPLSVVLAALRDLARLNSLEPYERCGEGVRSFALELELLQGKTQHAELIQQTSLLDGVIFCEEMGT